MNVKEFYCKIREEFPELLVLADQDFEKKYGALDHELSYLWFESLANGINIDMCKGTSAEKYRALFERFRTSYLFEGDDVKNCINVSFVENLFWQVPEEKAEAYWALLPDLLKDLYFAFHNRRPA